MGDFTIDIRSTDGKTRIAYLDGAGIVSIDYVLTENAPHPATFTFPTRFLPSDALAEDTRFYVYRRPVGSNAYQLEGNTCFLLQDISRTTDLITVSAVGAMDILNRRIVNYTAGSAEARKSEYADEMMRLILDENHGPSATGTGREIPAELFDIPNQRTYLSAIVSEFPQIEIAFAWDNVLATFQKIAAACAAVGTFMSFDVAAIGQSLLGFRTWAGTRGGDRRKGSTGAVVLSEVAGNLTNVTIKLAYSESKTYVRAGGQGEGSARALAEAIDTTRVAASPWGRREHFHQATSSDTTDALQDEANATLWGLKPKLAFEGTIQETPQFRYGIEFGLGTLLTADTNGGSFECRLSTIHVSRGQDGVESIDIKTSGETAI